MKVVSAGGQEIDLGTVQANPTIGIIDYSRRVTDDFGVTTVVKRGFARRMSVRLSLPFDQVGTVQHRLADLRAESARWIADDRFSWLDFQGFYKEFELDLAVPPLSYCTLTVEGLAEIEAGADTGGDPAPEGSTSSFLLLQPAAITDQMLVASNVPETDYPEWAAATTYATGARVIKTATHRVYESAIDSNTNHDPAAVGGQWIDIGPTNRWALFDQALGTFTSRDGGLALVLEAGAVDAIALLDVTGSTVRVQKSFYDRTLPVGPGATIFRDLPYGTDQVIVTISGAGPVAVGTLLVGHVVKLGITGESPTAGITDFSRKDVDDFGEVTVVQRAWAKRMSAKALIRTDAVDLVANRIATVRGRPSLWIGTEGEDSLTVYGFFKDFSIEVGENVSTLSLSVEGLSQAAQPAPPPPPPAWLDSLFDDTFDPAHWSLPSSSIRAAYAASRSGYALTLPFTSGTDVRAFNTGAATKLQRTEAGKKIFIRVHAVGGAFSRAPLEFAGEALFYGVDGVAFAAVTGGPDFGLEVAIDWLDSAGAFVSRTVVATVTDTGGDQLINGAAIAPNTGLARISFGYPSQTGKSGGWTIYEPWIAEYEPTADNTASSQIVVVAPSDISVSFDYTGTTAAAGQLPRLSSAPTVTKGAVSVRTLDSTTYAASFVNCTGSINNTAGSPDKGKVTITAVTALSGWVDIVPTVEGQVQPYVRMSVSQQRAPAPAASPATGGSGTAPSSNSAVINNVTGTSFAVISGPMAVRAGAGGKIDLLCSTDFVRSPNTSGTSFMTAKFQITPLGAGTWADVSPGAVTSANPTSTDRVSEPGTTLSYGDFEKYPGDLLISTSATGLTAGNDYEIRLQGYSSDVSLTPNGTISGTGA